MADRELTTIAILGAGPAGCAAAITLRRYLPEIATVIVAMPAASGPVAGETLSPGVLPLLEYLGVREEFLRAGHLPAGGTSSAWGGDQLFERNYLFTGSGVGWHLDRSGFDAWLLERARAAGARCVPTRARPKGTLREGGRWNISLANGETISADALIDATGRTACFARERTSPPRRDDALVADIRWYAHDSAVTGADGALVEAAETGWWYSATLPGRRGVAMFMTDADLLNRAGWAERLTSAPATVARMGAWRESGEKATRAANSQVSEVVAGDGWVACGDAAAAFDPISSLGIGFALRSGMEAARVAAGAVEGDGGPAAAYAGSVARIYDDYRNRLRRTYLNERRWPLAPFWARRRW